ncbi:hypothetical protein [Paracoccus marcusii]|uniref:hypothetical protein n=1 Tax=Paracoccus marcusii TaxID=59779 RepID=UPI00326653C4
MAKGSFHAAAYWTAGWVPPETQIQRLPRIISRARPSDAWPFSLFLQNEPEHTAANVPWPTAEAIRPIFCSIKKVEAITSEVMRRIRMSGD